MASLPVRKSCDFCNQFATVLRNGWQLRDGTFSHLCDSCFFPYERGTFCEVFHGQEGGWRNCDSCEEQFHCGCIMSSHLFEINDDASGICCKACLSAEGLRDSVSSMGSTESTDDGFSIPLVLSLPSVGVASADEVPDCNSEEKKHEENATNATLTLSASPEKTRNTGGPGTTLGVEPCNLLSLIDDNYFCPEASSKSPQVKSGTLQETEQKEVLQNSGGVVGRGMVETTEPSHSGLTFLFEKQLTASDCDANMGCLLIPRSNLEAYLLTPNQRGACIRVTDTEGKVWSFEPKSWGSPYNKILLGGTMNCIKEMQWETGDLLKFYRNNADGKIIMELKKIDTGAPTK